VAEVAGKPVGTVFCLLDYNPRIKAINGRLFPFGFLRLLWNKRGIKRMRAISTNVVPEYQVWGVGLALTAALVGSWAAFALVTMLVALAPDEIVRKGIFQVMEGRRIIEDMTVIENLRLGAYTRRDNGIKRDLDMVFDFFPRLRERTGLAGYLSGGEQQMLAISRALMARPKMILLDEPSMGLSPLLVKEVFDIIRQLNRELGITMLLVEQNARMALKASSYGYIMESGKVVLDGAQAELINNEDVKEFYLGGGDHQRRSFKNLKSYKRRKRWL
jgi:ABC-type branched-subunit amino acid transport system ATPase component